ncbi:BC1872 family protein [Heyndrickxia oleronia]|uniref:BC1872 family protein n=1 Tax=Heyndrickxia oleronia TaxID=38875 RepID=UPI001C0EC280|nr:hypothetical protein [Heyndrickxia oleronia]MBU5213399.1 hypothetical protein [Heyndrickxia oleronia]
MNIRKIECLIAENVFGWKTTYYQNIDIISAFTEDEEISIPDHFSPTSDITDSWKVIKELRYKGIYVTIDSMNCTVTAFVMKEDQTPPYNYRSTLATEQCESIEMNDLPLKICLVALKSLGVNVEGIVT